MNTKNGRKRNKRGYTENQCIFDPVDMMQIILTDLSVVVIVTVPYSIPFLQIVLTQEGYGYSWLVTHEDGKQFGDCGELFAILQVLCNSKAFIEFLCTFRHYAYAANLSKKSYFLLVFSSFLRGELQRFNIIFRYCICISSCSIICRSDSIHYLLL